MEEELIRLNQICLEDENKKPDHKSPTSTVDESSMEEHFVDLNAYLGEHCPNLIKILDRSVFKELSTRRLLAFNHFREKCFYHRKWLDLIFRVAQIYKWEIEFFVGDQMDLDVMYPYKNPADFFLSLNKPEMEALQIFAIDARQRVRRFEYRECNEKSLQNLQLVCKSLIEKKLFPSQPPREIRNKDTFLKICVHNNYQQLVADSKANILLIIELQDFAEPYNGRGYNYEEIARECAEYAIETYYLNGLRNYVPFEFSGYRYPQLIYIAHDEKENFLHYSGRSYKTKKVIAFVKDNMGQEGRKLRQSLLAKTRHKQFHLPPNITNTMESFQQFLAANYENSFKILQRQNFHNIQNSMVIYFMDLEHKPLHLQSPILRQIYNVSKARHGYGIDYLVANIKDLDILYPKWYQEEFLNTNLEFHKTRTILYKIDRCKRIYKIENFRTPSSLFYHLYYFNYTKLYRSESWSEMRPAKQGLTSCVANNFKSFVNNSKKDIFLTIYSSADDSSSVLTILPEIAKNFKKTRLKFLQINSALNYIPLEYVYHVQPIHFYIPHKNKEEQTKCFLGKTKERILELLQYFCNRKCPKMPYYQLSHMTQYGQNVPHRNNGFRP